jgi:hypothetical protein
MSRFRLRRLCCLIDGVLQLIAVALWRISSFALGDRIVTRTGVIFLRLESDVSLLRQIA